MISLLGSRGGFKKSSPSTATTLSSSQPLRRLALLLSPCLPLTTQHQPLPPPNHSIAPPPRYFSLSPHNRETRRFSPLFPLLRVSPLKFIWPKVLLFALLYCGNQYLSFQVDPSFAEFFPPLLLCLFITEINPAAYLEFFMLLLFIIADSNTPKDAVSQNLPTQRVLVLC